MPLFGVDDVLFILAATSVLLWAKRGEVFAETAYVAVAALTNDVEKAKEVSERVSSRYATPTLLLRGFDLQESYKLALMRSVHQRQQKESTFVGEGDAGDGTMGSAINLVRTSVVGEFEPTVSVHEVPNLPHRHYNPSKRIPHVSVLVSYTEDDIAAKLTKYTPIEVQTVFDKIEREGLWEAAVKLSRGIDNARQRLRYLPQRSVEAALRTLFTTAHGELAVAYYFSFGEDMFFADDIIVALFDACRHAERATLDLYRNLKSFQSSWTPTVYACCLTANSRVDYNEALKLYDEYTSICAGRLRVAQNPLHRLFASSSTRLDSGGVRLQYLYHIVIPLVMEREPEKVEQYVKDMMRTDPDAAPDVFLRCCHLEIGRKLAMKFLDANQQDLTEVVLRRGESSERAGSVGSVRDMLSLSFALYHRKPSSMNLNSLLKVITQCQREAAQQQECAGNSRNAEKTLASWTRQCAASATELARKGSTELSLVFDGVPFQSEYDPHILARTITENHASWAIATQFLSSMIRRKYFTAVPTLAHHLARQGRWPSVAKAMTIYLSNTRNLLATEDVSLCVEASVRSGRWSSALFWMDRAHARGMVLPSHTFDIGLSASRHYTWEAALRTVTQMHDVGGVCSQQGIFSVVQASSRQNKVAQVLHVLSSTGTVSWTP